MMATATPPVQKRSYKVPFNAPAVMGRELEYVKQALDNLHVCGDGPFTRRCQDFLQTSVGVTKALITSSCTHALEMAAILLEIEPGDEVIVPSYTFVSSINAFVLRGARPVFADIRADTLNIDESLLPHLITSRTKAIVVVHYAGVGCEMAEIARIAEAAGVAIVEDNAHGLFGKYRGRNLGTFGVLSTLSFHETKNFSCGEGGALLINDSSLVNRAEVVREKGTDRSRFFRGEVDRYTWRDIGSSYLISDMMAGFLWGQLEECERVQSGRARIWNRYRDELESWAVREGFDLPVVPADREQSFHMFFMLAPRPSARDAFLEHMKSRGVLAVSHYQPLNTSAMGAAFGGREGDCPVSEAVSVRVVRLPFYNLMTPESQEVVIRTALEFRG